jgi:hypothetical protein
MLAAPNPGAQPVATAISRDTQEARLSREQAIPPPGVRVAPALHSDVLDRSVVATLLSATAVLFVPAAAGRAGRPGGRCASRWRLTFVAFGSLLALWGALRPW